VCWVHTPKPEHNHTSHTSFCTGKATAGADPTGADPTSADANAAAALTERGGRGPGRGRGRGRGGRGRGDGGRGGTDETKGKNTVMSDAQLSDMAKDLLLEKRECI
jgi:hypothetical protein